MALEHCIICLSPTTSITSCYARYALSLALFKVQFVCLQVALEQGTISLSVATELFKTARLTKAESTKDATLANDPCTENEDDYTFTVANYNDTATTSARERYLGLTNRVIAGMLLFKPPAPRPSTAQTLASVTLRACAKEVSQNPFHSMLGLICGYNQSHPVALLVISLNVFACFP